MPPRPSVVGMRTRAGAWAATAVALVALTGCVGVGAPGAEGDPSSSTAAPPSAGPTSTPTSTATSAPTPPAEADPLAAVDTVVFGATALSLRDGDVEVGTVPLVGEPLDDAVSVLTRVLGEPVADGVLGGHCAVPQTRWAWGEVRLGTADLYTDEGSLVFRAEQASVSTPDGRDVRIETPGGVAVGDPIGPLAAQVPVEHQSDFDPNGTGFLSLVYDLVRTRESAGETNPYGAIAWSEGGTVAGLGGPGWLLDEC